MSGSVNARGTKPRRRSVIPSDPFTLFPPTIFDIDAILTQLRRFPLELRSGERSRFPRAIRRNPWCDRGPRDRPGRPPDEGAEVFGVRRVERATANHRERDTFSVRECSAGRYVRRWWEDVRHEL